MIKLILNKDTKIGWIGTGVMGNAMCSHILNKGYKLSIFTRTKYKAINLLDKGAKWCNTPGNVAENSDIIFTMVGLPSDVKQVYFSKNGIFEGLKNNTILVDMTTTEPSLSVEIYNKASEKGCSSVDAPVSGGDVGAREAKLSIMVGGDKNVVNMIMPLFKLLGSNIVYQGGAGSGQHTKMCNQIAVTGVMISTCETLLYAYRAGLDVQKVLASITKGAATSWTLVNLAPRIIKEDFTPGFYVEHFIKDMNIAIKESKKMGLILPGLSLAYKLYSKLNEMGHGKSGTQALILALDNISK